MISIISSTNRPQSLSYRISLYYQQVLNDFNAYNQVINLGDLPPDYIASALYENAGKNESFNVLRALMRESKKYVFIVPEYNGSFPGVLKAFIDGLEYPGTFKNKKAALVGVSSGVQGAGLALSHLTDILNYCGTHVLALKPKLSRIEANLDEHYSLTNQSYKDLLSKQAEMLVKF